MPKRSMLLVGITALLACCANTERVARSDAGADVVKENPTYCGATGDILQVRDTTSLAGCSWARGSVHLQDWHGSSLPLETLTRVDESLLIFRPFELTSLRGLDRLRSVGGELAVYLDDSGKLTSVDGLDALKECGLLRIRGNSGLTQLRGLRALEVVHGDLEIEGNTSLPQSEVAALLSHVRVEGSTRVSDNKP